MKYNETPSRGPLTWESKADERFQPSDRREDGSRRSHDARPQSRDRGSAGAMLSRLVDEEQFGPVLPVTKYSDNEDAIRRAEATNYGLGASAWSSHPTRALQDASRV